VDIGLPWQEHAVFFRRPAAAIGLQPAGGLRRPQRCGETLPGPDLPADRLGKDLGSGGGAEIRHPHPRQRQPGAGHRRTAAASGEGRPSQKPLIEYKGFLYQAASWKTARRVVAKVEHHAGKLFPRVGFIVTNLTLPSRAVVRFYKRGTSEQWIKEGKQAVKMTRLSCHRFRSNEVRLLAERHRLQPGEPVAAAGATEENRQVVADELAAAAGENGRSAGEACPILLALAGREPSDAPAVRGHAAPDRVVAPASGIGGPPTEPTSATRGRRTEGCQRRRSNEG